ncbi:hypothetical protein BJ912DRAFT_701030 [Pholiota molesta]|nr:hypothetical protein BJ912DRAFT_701030 [Pholiota molesta]
MDSRFTRFKFANTPRPPPPPPKDDIYQRTGLVAALDPPASPLSPTSQFALRRAHSPSPSPFSATAPMNASTPSLLSPPLPDGTPGTSSGASSSSGGSGARQTVLSTASKKDKALAFLKFPKRSPRTPPAAGTSSSAPVGSVLAAGADDDLPPPPQEDDGISLPWNFQHNIHVDEGYIGIPPSWSTSLATAGFTEEEIAAIQARRAAGIRSPPDLRYLYNERPQSPAGMAFPFPATSSAAVPILAHPLPRSTSLHRGPPSAVAPDPASSPFPPRPVLASISTSTSTGSNATASSSTGTNTPLSTRRPPPPRRKPPSPLEADLVEEAMRSGGGHKANQASQSTVGYSEEYSGSSSNHDTMDNTNNTSFAGLNNSVAYKYNPADTSTDYNPRTHSPALTTPRT